MSGGDIRVVAMAAAHLAAVTGLCAELGYAAQSAGVGQRFAALGDDPDHGLFVAVDDDGRVVGFIHVDARRMVHDETAAQVQAMAVATAHRRRGIGTLLLARAEAWTAERGLATVTLYSADGRHDAHGFYAALGYRARTGLSRYDKTLAVATTRRKA